MSLTPFLFTLDSNGDPTPAPDLQTWVQWMSNNLSSLIMQQDVINGAKIATGFVGVNVDIDPATGKPLLFQTSVTGGPQDGYKALYTNKTDALSGHATAVSQATANQPINIEVQ